jgi:hypothetical protein
VRWIVAALTAVWIAAPAGPIVAGDTPLEARVPIVVVDDGRSIGRAEADEIARGLGAPTVRGVELARAVRGAAPGATVADPGPIAARFAAALDVFYAGRHAEAGAEFGALVAAIEGDACALALEPTLRAVGFEARLYLAIIAHGDGDDAAERAAIAGAARSYPDLTPAPAEFPPWVREAHARFAAGQDAIAGEPPDVPRRCELPLGEGGSLAVAYGREVELRVTAGAPDDALAAGIAAVARAGGWPRAVGAIGRAEGLALLLVDAEPARVARTATSDRVGPAGALAAADALDAPDAALANAAGERAGAPWYRNGLAWAVTGIGLAAAGTGIALRQVYGSPAAQESAAWALLAAGAGVTATGVVLFLVPSPASEAGGDVAVAVGVSGAIAF